MGLAALRTALLGSAAIAVVMSTSAAMAQETNTGNFTLLERLVIGAGAEKVAIDTPQAVTVVSQEDIDDAQASTTGDILDGVPGVTAIGSDRVFGESFNIRGIGSLAASDESKIIVNVDGTPKFYEQYRMGSFFSDPELYKQVEVLRGPASSTLYGSGALGGVINLTTKDASDIIKPGMTGAVKVKGSYDSNGTGRLVSGIWATKLGDQAELLATGNYRGSNEFLDGSGAAISGSAFDAFSGMLKGTVYLDEAHEQIMRLSYQRWQSGADNQDYSQTGTSGFGDVDRNVTDQTIVWSYEDPATDNTWLDVNVALSYSDTLNQQRNATSASPSILFSDTDYAYQSLQLKADNTIEWIGDGFENYLTFGTQVSRQNRSAQTTAGGTIGFHPQGVENKIGVFVQNELIWDDRLTLIVGGRADYLNQVPDATIASASTVNDLALSPKIAAMYDFNEFFSVFGSLAHTQRAPTLDERFSTSTTQVASLNLEKELSNNVEVGTALSAHSLFHDGDTASLKVTGFYNDLTNLVTRNSGAAAGTAYYVNVDRANIFGFEVETAYNSEHLFARAAYSNMYGYDGSTGLMLNSIPAHKLSVTLGGRLPEYDLEAGWRANFANDTGWGTSGGTAAWQTHDVFASWTPETGVFEGTEARVSIENIFDADYMDNLAGDKGKGRTFKLTLAKQFDY